MSFYCSHIILKIFERDGSEITKVVNLGKCNAQPSSGKLIKFGKKINKGSRWNQVNNQDKGITWYLKSYYNRDRDEYGEKLSHKYNSRFNKEYNFSGYESDEIVIVAKPNKFTVYIFLEKNSQILFFGVTDSSFTFKPNQTICIYTKEIDFCSEIPLFIHLCFVNGSKNVNKYRRDFNKSPIKNIILTFPAEKFSSKQKLDEMPSPIPGDNEVYKFPNMVFAYSGLRRKELLKNWMNFKHGIPEDNRRIQINDNTVVGNPSGYDSDIEPLHLRRERLRRNRRIEAAIEAANFDYSQGSLSLSSLPEADENGYITFRGFSEPTYDINNPRGMFRSFKSNDNGEVTYFIINGKQMLFNPESECKVNNGQYAFYYCPTNETFGIRYKKEVRNDVNSRDNQDNNNSEDGSNLDVQAPMVNKYIYLDVLNPGLMPEMRPTTVDFYTKSYYHLGRLIYNEININHKEQVYVSKSIFERIWENRLNDNGNNPYLV